MTRIDLRGQRSCPCFQDLDYDRGKALASWPHSRIRIRRTLPTRP